MFKPKFVKDVVVWRWEIKYQLYANNLRLFYNDYDLHKNIKIKKAQNYERVKRTAHR